MTAPTARYQFEVTLHQGAIEEIFLDAMSTRGLIVDRPTTVDDLEILPADKATGNYRIKVTLRHLDSTTDANKIPLKDDITKTTVTNLGNEGSRQTIIYAKYVIGCDGAHSWIRKKMGITMEGGNTGKFYSIDL